MAMNCVRSMLQDSGLRPSFWAEALLAYVHTKNRCEHKLTEGLCPNEIWTGYKPSVKHFRIFGSLAYVHIPKVQRNKLQPRAKVGILVGYALKTKGYRVYIPKDRKVIESVHVRIDETKKGVKSLYGGDRCQDYATYILDKYEEDYLEETDENKLKSINISRWERTENPRNLSDRIDVYYFPPESNERLRSSNDVKKFCKKNKFAFEPNKFSFKPQGVESVSGQSTNQTCLSNDLDYMNDCIDIFQHESYNVELPKSFDDTQTSSDKVKWDSAMSEEIKMMDERQVWLLVDPPQNANVIGSKWVYNVKFDENNKPKKYKARLVAQGFAQKPGINFHDVFSPTVNFSIIKLLFILLVTVLNWCHFQVDVKSAYLYGTLKEPVYMRQPTGFVVKGAERKVCLLQKAIYGLHQSGREWNKELDKILRDLKFEKLMWCNCI